MGINVLFVFIGGGMGSMLRYLLSLIFPIESGHFPLATLLANILSCFVVGYLLALLGDGRLSELQKLLILTGFCGGLSTFSTFELEMFQLIECQKLFIVFTYLFLSLVLGYIFLYLGYRLGS